MKYLEWGGSDGSIKLRVNQSSAHNRELNKVIAVMEGAHNYNVKCATFSEDGTILVTGGEDAVVNVVECMKLHGQRIFKQLARLVGHLDSIESIAINKVSCVEFCM
jgi:WD40 repeat protein